MGKIGIYPGTFDPVTFGHVDVIKRASLIFDKVIVGVSKNTHKNPLFSVEDRVAMLKEVTKNIKNVEVEAFTGLVIAYAKQKNIRILIRGVRAFSDFDYEFQMALTNRRLDENIETVFLMPSEGLSFTTSSLLKEAASLGADVSSFVPKLVQQRLKEKLK